MRENFILKVVAAQRLETERSSIQRCRRDKMQLSCGGSCTCESVRRDRIRPNFTPASELRACVASDHTASPQRWPHLSRSKCGDQRICDSEAPSTSVNHSHLPRSSSAAVPAAPKFTKQQVAVASSNSNSLRSGPPHRFLLPEEVKECEACSEGQ